MPEQLEIAFVYQVAGWRWVASGAGAQDSTTQI
jgi:hypothetical protein